MSSNDSNWGHPEQPEGQPDEGLAAWGDSKTRKRQEKAEKARNAAAQASASPPPETGSEWALAPKSPRVRTRRRWVRVTMWAGGIGLLVLGVLAALAPTIAGGLAPGIVEGAVKDQIAGSIKVGAVRIGWGGPAKIGPIELRDDRDRVVGVVEASIPVGVWRVLSEGWWSKKNFDLGVIDITGSLDVVRGTDDKTNLDRALAPGPKASKPKPASSGGGVDTVKATLRLKDVDVSYTDKTAPAGTPMGAGIGLSKFGGDISVSYDAAGNGAGTGGAAIKGDLAGNLRTGKGAGSAGDKLHIVIDADVKQDSRGGLDAVKASIDLTGAPIDLVDGLVGFKGELVKSVGPRAGLRILADGNLDRGKASFKLTADGADIDLATLYKDGVLTSEKPGRLWIRSTNFLATMPSLQPRLARLKDTVRLDAGPSVEVTIDSLKLPLPREMLGQAPATKPGSTRGGAPGAAPAGGGKFDLMQIDLRKASLQLTARVGEIKGVQTFDSIASAGTAGAGGAPGQKPAMKPFHVEPLELKLAAADLTLPLRATAGTKATIDGRPAGELAVDVSASGVLDDQGRLSPGTIKRIEGQARLSNVSSSLAQPIADALNLHVDMSQDVGPTVDLRLTAATAGSPVGGPPSPAPPSAPSASLSAQTLPPTDLTLELTSTNIHASGAMRLENSVLTSTGDGVMLKVGSAAPLAGRMIGAGGGGVLVGGKGAITVTAKNISMPLPAATTPGAPAENALAKMQADVSLVIDDLTVTLAPPRTPSTPASTTAPSTPPPPQPPPPPSGPITLTRLAANATLKPGAAPSLSMQSSLSHGGSPFTLTASAGAPGLVAPNPPPSPPPPAATPAQGPIDQLLQMGPTARVELRNLPRSLAAALAPALEEALAAGDAHDAAAEAKRLVSSLIGRNADITLSLEPGQAGATEKIAIEIKGGGVGANVAAVLRAKELSVESMTAETTLRPGDVNPLLAAVTPKSESAPATPAGAPPTPARPAPAPKPVELITLAEPVTLRVTVDPVIVPLNTSGGTVEPNLKSIGEAVAHLSTDQALMLSGVPVGDKHEAVGIKDLVVTAHVTPGSMTSAGAETRAAPARAELGAQIVRARTGNWSQRGAGAEAIEAVTTLRVDGTYDINTQNGDATVRLNDISSAALETLLNQPGQVTGALGDRAQITIVAHQQAQGAAPGGTAATGSVTSADVKIDSQRLKAESIKLVREADRVRIEPSRLTWTPSLAWANSMLAGGPGTPAAPGQAQPAAGEGGAAGGGAAGGGAGPQNRQGPINHEQKRLLRP